MRVFLLASMLPLFAGCDWDESDKHKNYDPPAGQGALRVANHTGDDIKVFVGGVELGLTGDYSDRVYNLDPGVYRVVLDQKRGDRSYRDDVDILEGRLTVMDVSYDQSLFDYDVVIFFD